MDAYEGQSWSASERAGLYLVLRAHGWAVDFIDPEAKRLMFARSV